MLRLRYFNTIKEVNMTLDEIRVVSFDYDTGMVTVLYKEGEIKITEELYKRLFILKETDSKGEIAHSVVNEMMRRYVEVDTPSPPRSVFNQEGLRNQLALVRNNYQPLTPTALQGVGRSINDQLSRVTAIQNDHRITMQELSEIIGVPSSRQESKKTMVDPDGNECPSLENIFTGKEMPTIIPGRSSGIEDMPDFETSFLNTGRARYREGGFVEENDPNLPLRSTGLEVRRPIVPMRDFADFMAHEREIASTSMVHQEEVKDRYNYWNVVKRLRKYFTVKLIGE